MKKYLVISFLCLSFFSSIMAQEDVKFSVTASSESVLLGNYIEVSLHLLLKDLTLSVVLTSQVVLVW